MKPLLIILIMLLPLSAISQEALKDNRTQLQKEDSFNLYNQEDITTLDMLEALDLASIRIHKFALGKFDKKYNLQIIADEYNQGKIVNTDTLVDYNNTYVYWIDGKDYGGVIDQIKIFTKTDKNQAELMINTYSMSSRKKVSLNVEDERQFFVWRAFQNAEWKLEQKIPLLVFASSWLDKKNDFHRFCGVMKLNEGERETKKLFRDSPNYIIISYRVFE